MPGDELPGPEPREMLGAFEASADTAQYVNDLEPPAFELRPELKKLREALTAYGFQNVMMSGSGSTIFAIGEPDDSVADTWQAELASEFDAAVFAERFCNRPEDEKAWYE